MEVRLADCAGFCFGVKRAVDTVYEQLKNGKTIYTYGPIVHNEEVVRELAEKGVRVLESKEELKSLKAGENIPTVIIRAHGVAKEIYDIMEANGLECIDATCPFVKKIHRIVEQKSTEGYHVIVVGDPKHPEVEGIVGWCQGPVTVLETPEQAENHVPTFIKANYKCSNLSMLELTPYFIKESAVLPPNYWKQKIPMKSNDTLMKSIS